MIILSTRTGVAVQRIEFDSRATCENAKVELDRLAAQINVAAATTCVPETK